MRPKLFIFDCDGVLVDSEPIMNRHLSDNLAEYDLLLSPEECLIHFKGGSMFDVTDFAAGRGIVLPEGWTDSFYKSVYTVFETGVPVVEGIRDVLDTLDKVGIPYCVASNGSEEKMRITLGQNDLWERFADRCFSAHRYGPRKPDPTIFLAAADQFNIAVSDVIVVEDSVSGARAAKNAGMPCFGFAQHGDGSELAAEGATVIHALQEIIEFLEADS